jgi:hypothetical protein
MSLFSWLFTKPLPSYTPANKWCVPLAWPPKQDIRYTVTTFYEDLPAYCYVCGAETREEQLEPMYIEGSLQYMKRACYCPKGCGFTVWIA